MTQKNNFQNANFSGNTQIVNGDIHNIINQTNENPKAVYQPEPIWRSPITIALLTWASFIIAFIGIFPLYKLIMPIWNLIRHNSFNIDKINNNLYIFVLLFIFIIFITIQTLRKIAKNQTRYPLIFNYAINGSGHRITLEKITIFPCPKCGGEMRYYNKPTEWIDILYTNGRTKRKVTKTKPALECKRNKEHWYEVDPAEDKV